MLKKFKYSNIELSGWIERQLKIQAEGLSGHLDLIWPDIKDSAWIGGTKDCWERVPYWLDGFIPLAYLLKDDNLILRAQKYINAIISNQQEDGWICPCKEDNKINYDIWALFLICKVLSEYYLYAGDEKAYIACYKALKNCYLLLKENKIRIYEWAKYRWFECLIPLRIIKEKKDEQWMDELADLLYKLGAHYLTFKDKFIKPLCNWTFDTHVVNLAMALKGEEEYLSFKNYQFDGSARKLYNYLMKYNATGVGTFSGDECLAGKSPIRGTELCSVVEAMYSYERLFMLTQDTFWIKCLEEVAFNALPATVSEDMWTHQYDQQVNQISCKKNNGRPIFGTNGDESNLFGLEPNFGCCTSNFSQGFPKLAHFIFLQSNNDIIITIPLQSSLKTIIDGKNVEIKIKSDYPFKNRIIVDVINEENANCNIYLNIQKDARKLMFNGKVIKNRGKIKLMNGHNVISFDYEIKMINIYKNMFAIRQGNLIYSLGLNPIYEKKEYIKDGVERKYPYCDYELYTNDKWQYAYVKAPIIKKELKTRKVSFSFNSPCYLETEIIPINWPLEDGYLNICKDNIDEIKIMGKRKKVKLIPYGCTKLRVTALPLVKD